MCDDTLSAFSWLNAISRQDTSGNLVLP